MTKRHPQYFKRAFTLVALGVVLMGFGGFAQVFDFFLVGAAILFTGIYVMTIGTEAKIEGDRAERKLEDATR